MEQTWIATKTSYLVTLKCVLLNKQYSLEVSVLLRRKCFVNRSPALQLHLIPTSGQQQLQQRYFTFTLPEITRNK
jgi:hypothetical protein